MSAFSRHIRLKAASCVRFIQTNTASRASQWISGNGKRFSAMHTCCMASYPLS